MDGLKDPVADILQKYRDAGAVKTVSDKDHLEAEKQINDKMAVFSLEMRAYFNESIESARHAYLTC